MNVRYSGLDYLVPSFRRRIENLRDDLASMYVRGTIPVLFRPFETYRSPERQKAVFDSGNSRAVPWFSPHNYGLACDFAPWTEERSWHWNIPDEQWAWVGSTARRHGLDAPISWDRGHVEGPEWPTVRTLLGI